MTNHPTNSDTQADKEIDTSGLLCPLPVIRTQDALKTMQPGQILSVVATDPGAAHDIPAWCRVHGHELLAHDETEFELCFKVRKR